MKLSIICPIRNDISNFSNLITSLRNSDFSEITEIIVVNDASNDAAEIAYEEILKSSGIPFKYIFNKMRVGITGSIYIGASSAENSNVLILEGDNEVSANNLKVMLQKRLETDADVIQGIGAASLSHEISRTVKSTDGLIRLFINTPLQSPSSLFILTNRELLLSILKNHRLYSYKHLYFSSLVFLKGYQVEEVVSSKKNAGETGQNLKVTGILFRVFLDLLGINIRRVEKERKIAHSLPLIDNPLTLPLHRKARLKLYFWTFPIHKWMITSDSLKYYKTLKALEFAKNDEMQNLAEKRLKRILLHCFNNVPYYSELWKESGFKHEDFHSKDILQKIPLLTKEDVTANRDGALFSKFANKNDILEIKTSGSSGQPFITFADRFQLEIRFATTMRALEMTGYEFGDRQLRLWHQKIGMSKFQARAEKIDAWLLRRTFIPAFELSSVKLRELNHKLIKRNPILIDGYAESMNYLAGNKEIQGSVKALKGIMTSAQELTKPTREAIEDKFGVLVFDKYGSREFSGIAYECREGRVRHVQDESYVLEILKGGKRAEPGEVGEVVITDLNNYSFPLIRYRIGDLALCLEQRNCVCGRPLSQIGPIQGRAQALVSCANGVWLPGTFFAHFFKEYENLIKYFQVVQSEKDSFTLKYVKAGDFTEASFFKMQEKLSEFTGVNTVIDFDEVDEIPLLKTGKRTPVVSYLKPDFQDISR